MDMYNFARLFIFLGLTFLVIGGIAYVLTRFGLPLGHLPGDIRISISAAFLAMLGNEAGQAALRDTYRIDGLKLIDDSFYDALRRMLEQSGLGLSTLVR